MLTLFEIYLNNNIHRLIINSYKIMCLIVLNNLLFIIYLRKINDIIFENYIVILHPNL